jgi:hypothetical protein
LSQLGPEVAITTPGLPVARISLGREDAPCSTAQEWSRSVAARVSAGAAAAIQDKRTDLDAVPDQRLDQNIRPVIGFRKVWVIVSTVINGGHGGPLSHCAATKRVLVPRENTATLILQRLSTPLQSALWALVTGHPFVPLAGIPSGQARAVVENATDSTCRETAIKLRIVKDLPSFPRTRGPMTDDE